MTTMYSAASTVRIKCLIVLYKFQNVHDILFHFPAIKQGVELLNTEAFRALGAKLHWPTFPECGGKQGSDNQRYMECLVRTAALTMYHPAGTATMGHEDNPDAVVDPELRFE